MTEADVPEVATETVDTNGYQVDARIMEDLEAMFEDARVAGENSYDLFCFSGVGFTGVTL